MKTSILTGEGLTVLVEEIRKLVQDQIAQSSDSVLEYDSSLLFPTVGKANTVYIDTTGNESYRWDDTDLKYYRLDKEDYTDIKIIDGCVYPSGETASYNLLVDESGNYLTDESGNYLCLEV